MLLGSVPDCCAQAWPPASEKERDASPVSLFARALAWAAAPWFLTPPPVDNATQAQHRAAAPGSVSGWVKDTGAVALKKEDKINMDNLADQIAKIEKVQRLNEWRLKMLLEQLEELNRDMDRAAEVWEVGR